MIVSNITNFATVRGKVGLYDGATLIVNCTCNDRLVGFNVERIGEKSKFFGVTICQKITLQLIDLERNLQLEKGHIVKVELGDGATFVEPFPQFFIDEVSRSEDTNELTVTAYDAIYKATSHTVSELPLSSEGYTLQEFAQACATVLGTPLNIEGVHDNAFATEYATGANFGGDESIRQGLGGLAEATQTICFVNPANQLTFKRLDLSGDAVLRITKNEYFQLTTGTPQRLNAICSVTELGENVEATLDGIGVTQYVRENPFWNMRDDVATLLQNALDAVGGMTINPFVCADWMGNYLLEIGDKIALETEDGGYITAFLLDDVIVFDGTLSDTTQWIYDKSDDETASNPATLGEVLKQTFARVDKQNGQIELVAKSNEINAQSISGLSTELENISSEVALKVNAQDVQITVRQELETGVSKVETQTGYKFDDSGLHIEKTGSEMKSTLDEDGLAVSRSNTEVLTAKSDGVNALNITVRQYLVVGGRSRFENYGNNRTGCFWIGG